MFIVGIDMDIRAYFTTESRVESSGCGSDGRAVASNSRGPRFKSSHRQNLYKTFYCQLYWKDENKEKEAANGTFF